MGVILYILISGVPPFYGTNDFLIMESVKKGKYEFDCIILIFINSIVPIWKTISFECKDLISKMLVPSAKRLSSQEVVDHLWFKKMADPKNIPTVPPFLTKNLMNFKSAQKLKKAVLTYIATQVSEKDIGALKKLFQALDKNGDGRLSNEEILDGLKGREDEKELGKVLISMDTDGNGYIDYNGNILLLKTI